MVFEKLGKALAWMIFEVFADWLERIFLNPKINLPPIPRDLRKRIKGHG